MKGDTSVVLEGSDDLEDFDKFLGDKVSWVYKQNVTGQECTAYDLIANLGLGSKILHVNVTV